MSRLFLELFAERVDYRDDGAACKETGEKEQEQIGLRWATFQQAASTFQDLTLRLFLTDRKARITS